MQQNINLPPAYKQTIEEIGKQLQLRKKLLFKRVLLIIWPILLGVIIGYLLNSIYDLELLSVEQETWGIIVATIYILCSVIYARVVGFIFEIEKQIWIDSFFDQKHIDSDTSWKISKKLFWPGLMYRLKIFCWYYLLPVGSLLILIGAVVVSLVVNTDGADDKVGIVRYAMFALSAFAVGVVFYIYFLKIRLRYSWFIFLDTFGGVYSFGDLMLEMNKLNAISKTETFKKSLVANLGTDSLKGLTNVVVGTLALSISKLGGVGEALGSLTRVYGNELARQTTDLANITAQYLIYKFARKELYSKDQVVNEALYKL